MPILKATSRPAASIRVERVAKEQKGPLKPSGGGIKKTTKSPNGSVATRIPANASSSSAVSSSGPTTSPLSRPSSGPSARSQKGSSTGSSASVSKTARPAQPKPKKPKTSNVMGGLGRSKKLLKAGSVPGLMAISSFSSGAAAMRADLAANQLREKKYFDEHSN
ncbi:hypothetical protein LX32DRAFT_693489 [Colletotrichum zoysiae]|uniref:Uncharacterized protein n=1 Tax=Colletotrichum zoysiae TaxID=1216348 RepID=A0AAD9M088_9PEZI|nr:hypothetical protein LX32DRAFT_693489 [Colletotrichum zoysiae]